MVIVVLPTPPRRFETAMNFVTEGSLKCTIRREALYPIGISVQ
jgi:hypothetical protein